MHFILVIHKFLIDISYYSMLSAPTWKLKPQLCKEHPDEHFSFICFDDQCKKKGPICAECLIFDHSKHSSKPIALALKEISRDLQPLPITFSFMVRLDNLRVKFHSLIVRLGQHRNELETQVSKLFKSANQKLTQYHSLCRQILAQSQVGSEFNRLIQRYRFFQKQEEDINKTNYQIFMADIVKQIQERSDQFQEAVSRRDQYHELLKLLAPIEAQAKASYFFSPSLHHANINITPDGLTASQLNNYSTNFAFIEPMVMGKRKISSKKTIRIQINKLHSWLSVGAAYLSFAKKNNFYFNTGSLGHGGYMVSYNSYSWHHSDSTLNSNYIPAFAFNQGDIISVTINPSLNRIIFQRDGILPYEMPYEKLAGEELFFCVSLSSHEESVTLVK